MSNNHIRIETLDDVTAHMNEVMAKLAVLLRDNRQALGLTTISWTMYCVIRYADAREDPLHPTEAKLTYEWLRSLWETPEQAMKGARERMGRIGSLSAVEALAVSAPGTAWSEFAKYEVARRRGELADWREENGVIRVEAAPRQPSSAGGTEG